MYPTLSENQISSREIFFYKFTGFSYEIYVLDLLGIC